MSTLSRPAQVSPAGRGRVPDKGGTSPVTALTDAFSDSLQLLFNPFDAGRWLKLSVICLFLGGGTASAAFHWVVSTLPGDLGFQHALEQLRAQLARLPGFLYLTVACAACLGVAIIYTRATCRFALVQSILEGETRFRRGWRDRRPMARSYFRWLLGALATLGTVLGAGLLFALPRLRAEAEPGLQSLVQSITLAGFLFGEVSIALVAGVIITLTDDFAVPIMYAEKLPLLAAWRKLAQILRAEPAAFLIYFLVRLVVSAAIGVAVLFLLFPALVALFSGAVVVGALVVLTLRLVGVVWVWTPFTIVVTALALSNLMGLVLVLLGVAGMPGQVYLQTFGMRFLSPRHSTLDSLWQGPSSSEEQA